MRFENDPKDHGTRLNYYEEGVQKGTLVYDWVTSLLDIWLCDHKGVKTKGDVLYISDLEIEPGDPKRIWRFKKMLPRHQWICGLKDKTYLIAPYGLPEGFI